MLLSTINKFPFMKFTIMMNMQRNKLVISVYADLSTNIWTCATIIIISIFWYVG